MLAVQENIPAVKMIQPLLKKQRIQSIDFLKGLVMVIMALDHTRDYFHFSSFFFDPSDPAKTTWPIYLTRYATHFCAPAFSFLAGLSAFMVGKRKSKNDLAVFLLKRGLWLILVELTIVTFAWRFDPQFRFIQLQTLWQLGISMIVLAGLIYLPVKAILIFSVVIIFGHNLLDSVHFKGDLLWAFVHDRGIFEYAPGCILQISYPLIPWIAVMSLGYCFGTIYNSEMPADRRKKLLNRLGLASLLLFFVIIAVSNYGDPVPWKNYGNTSQTVMSMLNITKYPPSLKYLSITLGLTFFFLANVEKLKGAVVNFFSVFGRVPFFYYIVHIFPIHFIALVAAELTGFGWKSMILPNRLTQIQALKGFGFSIWVVYIVWILVVLMLYPLCKKFDRYKQSHKEKWWLSYL